MSCPQVTPQAFLTSSIRLRLFCGGRAPPSASQSDRFGESVTSLLFLVFALVAPISTSVCPMSLQFNLIISSGLIPAKTPRARQGTRPGSFALAVVSNLETSDEEKIQGAYSSSLGIIMNFNGLLSIIISLLHHLKNGPIFAITPSIVLLFHSLSANQVSSISVVSW